VCLEAGEASPGTNTGQITQWLVQCIACAWPGWNVARRTLCHTGKKQDSIMKKKQALIEGVNRLKASHEQAAAILQGIVHEVVRVSKSGEGVPERRNFRRYRRAIKELKLQCLQVEMVLAEFDRED
jgi:hypothetical protein